MSTDGLARKPAFWIAYALVACASLVIAWRLFPLAIPIVNLEIRLDRGGAIERAGALAARLELAPPDARSSAQFAQDQATQNYVELEGGGKDAFAKLVAGDVYAPYWWEVRLFRPGEVSEATVRFRPDGTPYGFTKRLAETFVPADAAGLALPVEDALRLAETRAHADWGVDLAAYRLLEKTQQTRTTGRVDHTFVYERSDERIADARFRMQLVVSGNELSALRYFVHVPESFDRRYQELRSANNTIAGAASVAAGILYGLGGCIFGVLWLARRHGLLWRPARNAGFVVGGLMGLMVLASAPAAWFGFDTAQSVQTFWLREVGAALAVAFLGGLALGLVFMAAESLSRFAFAGHPQLWRVWSPAGAPTRAVLGRTLGGYLFVPIELALITVFYYVTNRWAGWWQPSEILTDPNILSSFVPALTPIAQALQAGFMEECLFRAVPISLAAIVGAHYGRRGVAIGIAVVVQALVFGAAHANYPGFPSYSRLIELVVPAMLWALIFLRYGLVPTILLHGLFDLVLMSIPVFLVDAPGADLQRALVIAAGVVPIAIVLVRTLQAGGLKELAGDLRNGAWRPREAVDVPAPTPTPQSVPEAGWIRRFQRALPVLGIAGLAVWVAATPFRIDTPPLAIDRSTAMAAADTVLRERGVTLGPEWQRMATTRLVRDEPLQWQAHKFVWREAGRDTYAKLIGNTLAPPLWNVRYAKFSGDVADRAEEWRVTVDGRGAVRQVSHRLPEARAGATLTRDAALTLARRTLADRLSLDPAALKLVGADEKAQPARLDWSFTFADPRIDVGKEAEARAVVGIGGDEVASYGRYVQVPERWQRSEREQDGRISFVRMSISALVALAALAALVMAMVNWTRRHCDRRALVGVATIAFVLMAVTYANAWPALAMALDTTEPVASQIGLSAAAMLLGATVAALLFGLLAGVGAWATQRQPAHEFTGNLPAWLLGVAAALVAAGVGAALGSFAPATVPKWPDYPFEALALPSLGAAVNGMQLVASAGVGLFFMYWLERVTGEWRRHGWVAMLALVAVVTIVAVVDAPDILASTIAGIATGLAAAAIVFGLLRFDYCAIPAYMATGIVLHAIASAVRGGAGDAYGLLAIDVATTVAATWLVTRYLERARAGAHAPPAESVTVAVTGSSPSTE
jgi:hypothetical protein